MMNTNEKYIQSIVNAMAVSGIISSDTIITGTQIAKILEQVKTLNVTADADATSDDIRQDKTAYVNTQKITGTLPLQTKVKTSIDNHLTITALRGIYEQDKSFACDVYNSTVQYMPKTYEQSYPTKNKYCTVNLFVKGDRDLIPANIKKGVTIFNVTGTAETFGNEYNLSLDIDTKIERIFAIVLYIEDGKVKIKVVSENPVTLHCSLATYIPLATLPTKFTVEDLLECSSYYASDVYSQYPIIIPHSNKANCFISSL